MAITAWSANDFSELDLLVVEWLHLDAAKHDCADRLVLPEQGHAQNGANAVAAHELPAFRKIIPSESGTS